MMSNVRVLFLSVALLVATAASSAKAQYDDNPDATGTGDNSVAGLGVKISQLQEQMRALEGKIEQVSFENKQLKEQLEKSNGDTQYRLSALEKTRTIAATTPAPSEAAPADTSQLRPVEAESIPESAGAVDDHAAAGQTSKYASAKDQYSHALALLNHDSKYAEAGAEFASFTKRYPKDPLIGNAYYWLGETQYVRRDYMTAANSFRQGYESMPTGPKASENLLKLAMSLDALNKDKEACVVLRQIITKFGSSGGSVKQRSEQEISRIGCK